MYTLPPFMDNLLSEERQLIKWVGIFQVGIFWMGIFQGRIFPWGIFLEPACSLYYFSLFFFTFLLTFVLSLK